MHQYPKLRYLKRHWNEPRDDTTNVWGCSWWYFETDYSGVVIRQIEVYDHGPILRYHELLLNDDFGGLSDQPLNLDEFAKFEISKDEFDRVWNSERDTFHPGTTS